MPRKTQAGSAAKPVAAYAAAKPDASARPDVSPSARTRAAEPSDTKGGGRGAGPPSSLKTKTGSGGVDNPATKNLDYSVQCHTDEKGLEVFEPINADSGDEAAQKVLAKKGYHGVSIRGVTPYSDPDRNSLGGERDAGVMIDNAHTDANLGPIGTEANAKAVEELGEGDIKDLGE